MQITDGNGVVQSNYIYGAGLLESIDASNNALYYHFDAQHNTTALTDQNSLIKSIYTYDPFGSMLSHAGTTIQPFTFLGEYGVEQESSSIYYARARYYDAINGRFYSKDSHPYDLNNPQTIDRYVYGTNNPLSIFDYTGLYGGKDNSGSTWNNDNGIYSSLLNISGSSYKNSSGQQSNLITFLDGLQNLLSEFNYAAKIANIPIDNSVEIGTNGVGNIIGLYNLYINANKSMNAFQNKTIGLGGLSGDFILSALDVYGGSSYDFKYEAQQTANDYVNGKIDYSTAWSNLFNGGVNALPFVGFVNKNISPKIMEGTSYGLTHLVNFLGDKIFQYTGY